MTNDVRAVQARKAHAAASVADAAAASQRAQRDELVRALRRDDPKRWSYGALAGAVGCSPELIAYICKTGGPA